MSVCPIRMTLGFHGAPERVQLGDSPTSAFLRLRLTIFSVRPSAADPRDLDLTRIGAALFLPLDARSIRLFRGPLFVMMPEPWEDAWEPDWSWIPVIPRK